MPTSFFQQKPRILIVDNYVDNLWISMWTTYTTPKKGWAGDCFGHVPI
jgi:hypothetical protein